MFDSLRAFIDKVSEMGEVKVIEGADPEYEIGVLTDLMAEAPNPPLLIFDKVKGCEPGYRVASNLFTTPGRTALGLGFSPELKGMELVKAMRDRITAGIELVPPVEVETGPVKENIDIGEQVDLFKFPTPKWHELDGGPYIGTGDICITRDPDEGWVNFGTYRVQIVDKSTLTILCDYGHHGNIIRQKYWDRGMSCPIAICCGQEPILFLASNWERVPWGVSEYDFAGGLRGEPVEITRGVTTDLPIPATAEIVIEGEWMPPDVETRPEGPFGDFYGYYASGQNDMPAVRVKSVLFRNEPIIQGNPASRFPAVWTLGRPIQKAATLWAELDRQIPGVQGVWMIEEATVHSIPVISIKQQYGGHAKQAAMLAAAFACSAFCSRFIIVVDEDIDPSNLSEVMWALGTRVEPESIDIVRDCWDALGDPMLSPEQRRLNQQVMTRALIVACKPYWWKDEFKAAIKNSPELLEKVKKKWAHLL